MVFKPKSKNTLQPNIHTNVEIDWDKIRQRAAKFVKEWQSESRETAESQTFWNQFFEIFGRQRRGLALYEYHARNLRDSVQKALTGMDGGARGRIDMLWPGVLAVEHKSAGKDLAAGREQLLNYIGGLPDDKKPRYGLVCDFANFRLLDIEQQTDDNFRLADLPTNVERFAFFIEREQRQFAMELAASSDAAKLMCDIYDALQKSGDYPELDRLLMRLLFCMFADATGIWEKGIFLSYLENKTDKSGDDLGARLEQIFDTLNTEQAARSSMLSAALKQFPYINGGLFADRIGAAVFDKKTRDMLLDACRFNWGKISPDIFGALFQSAHDPDVRHAGGEHYTSENNILKVIRPLFLDSLEAELRRVGSDKRRLKKLHEKISQLKFLDPACGCGNFLIITYRELRRMEMEILFRMYPDERTLNISGLCRVNVDQFYGMEINQFAARIAESALLLVDHQMNLEISKMFGGCFIRIPLTVSPTIVCVNALTTDWADTISPPKNMSYIFGNPPFVDTKGRTNQQRQDMTDIFNDLPGAGKLDYVAAWYMKAARYIRDTDIGCAYVSTDSITQSAQATILWGALYGESVKIHFAHRSFKWHNEGEGVAQVYVVIIGFGVHESKTKIIYDYDHARSEPRAFGAKNINAYLKDEPDMLVKSRRYPLCDALRMFAGSNPVDNGNLLFSYDEKQELLRAVPQASAFIRPAMSSREYLHNEKRWCLWLENANSSTFRQIPRIMARINKTKIFRQNSKRKETQKIAETSHLFGENRQPNAKYLVVPQTTSGDRQYIPMGFVNKNIIALTKCYTITNADLYHFGVLTSAMHMAWVRTLCGRLGSGYSYTVSLVYNTFPWPQNITATQKDKIKTCARAVLDARKNHNSTLADMYSNMPRDLLTAHHALDMAVDHAYRNQKFTDDNHRLKYLFDEYRRLTASVEPTPLKRRRITED